MNPFDRPRLCPGLTNAKKNVRRSNPAVHASLALADAFKTPLSVLGYILQQSCGHVTKTCPDGVKNNDGLRVPFRKSFFMRELQFSNCKRGFVK